MAVHFYNVALTNTLTNRITLRNSRRQSVSLNPGHSRVLNTEFNEIIFLRCLHHQQTQGDFSFHLGTVAVVEDSGRSLIVECIDRARGVQQRISFLP